MIEKVLSQSSLQKFVLESPNPDHIQHFDFLDNIFMRYFLAVTLVGTSKGTESEYITLDVDDR